MTTSDRVTVERGEKFIRKELHRRIVVVEYLTADNRVGYRILGTKLRYETSIERFLSQFESTVSRLESGAGDGGK